MYIPYQDYAKATVKEFLGIYGYEEDVDINMDDSETQKGNETSTSQAAEKQTETEPRTFTGENPLYNIYVEHSTVVVNL